MGLKYNYKRVQECFCKITRVPTNYRVYGLVDQVHGVPTHWSTDHIK
jgi:hypothetical protein